MEIILYAFDLHVHTLHSGDSPCTVEGAIQAAKKAGLSGIAITDHNSVEGLERAFEITDDEDFLVIPGIEVSSEDGHILGLGVEESIPRDQSAERVVDEIHDCGGVAISAHPFSLSLKPFSALKAEFDAIEVFNSRRYLGNHLAKKYALDQDLRMTAGSDAHFCEEVGLAGVKVDCELRLEEVLKKIKQGKASIFGRLLPPSGYLRRALFRFSAYR